MKSIIYYTDNRIEESEIYKKSQESILRSELQIFSASLKPINFGDNYVVDGERGYPTMVRQIISCLERSKSKYVFFCEHDVLYHKSHFDFTPQEDDIFYYNENVWRWMHGDDKLIRHDRMVPLSCMCVNRKFALNHFKRRFETIVNRGWINISKGEPRWARVMGYEPGTKKKKRGGFSDDDFETWKSEYPNIDIRHDKTFTIPKMSLSSFRHQPKWWKEININKVDGWNLKELFNL